MPSSSAINCIAVVGLLQSTKTLIYSAQWIIICKKITFSRHEVPSFHIIFRRKAAGATCRVAALQAKRTSIYTSAAVARPLKKDGLFHSFLTGLHLLIRRNILAPSSFGVYGHWHW